MDFDQPNLNLSDTDSPNTFSSGLGIISTNQISDSDIDSFLGTDPKQVIKITDEPVKKTTPAKNASPANTETDSPIVDDSILDDKEEGDEEPKTPKNPKEKAKEEETNNEEDEDPIVSVAKELYSLGILTEDEGEEPITDGNKLATKFESEIQKRGGQWIENVLSNFGDDRKDLFDAVFLNGVEPVDYIKHFVTAEQLGELDMSVVDNQKHVLKQYYKDMGMDDAKISSRIQRLEDSGDLEDDATHAHSAIVKKEKDTLDNIRAQKQQETAAKARAEQHYLQNVQRILMDKVKTKEFDGIPVTPEVAKQTQDFITRPAYKLPNGETLTEFDNDLLSLKSPENHELKVKYALLLQLLKKDPTLSTIKKKGVTQESNEVFKSLTRQKKTQNQRGEEPITAWGL